MKNILKLNLVFVTLPIILCLIGLVNEKFLVLGMLSTILTGTFQTIIAIKLLIENPFDKKLILYLFGVIIYFTLFFFTDFMDEWKFFYPQPFYAFYITYLIYKKNENSI